MKLSSLLPELGPPSRPWRRLFIAALLLNVSGIEFSRCFAASLVVAAQAHRLSVEANGLVCGAGENVYGQLGDGTVVPRMIPVPPAGVAKASSVATGARHSLAVGSDGTVWAWGANDYGQLGDGTTYDKLTPIVVPNLTGVIAVAAGQYHSVAVKGDGSVWTWGYNANGRLGDGTSNNSKVPVRVVGLTDVKAIDAGDDFTLALRKDGSVWAWGSNANGRLGIGSTADSAMAVPVAGLSGVQAIAAGSYHGLAVTSDGAVWAWGYNAYGELGNGNSTQQTKPVRAMVLTGVKAVAGGQYHSLAVKTDGTVWAWGYNAAGQLGTGNTTNRNVPTQVTALSGASGVAAGTAFSVAVKSDGSEWGWGDNSSGQLGNTTMVSSNVPVASAACFAEQAAPVTQLPNTSILSAEQAHRLMVRSNGSICAVGENDSAQLGDGTTVDRASPVFPIGIAQAVGVSTSNRHSLAVLADGRVFAWGANDYGQLGDGTITGKLTPVAVSNLTGVRAVAAGAYHSLALKQDGTVWAWGYNASGRLGDGTLNASRSPVPVVGLSDVAAIAAGDDFNLALKNDGTVWAWGNNDNGRLGNGTVTASPTPVQVAGLSGVVAITAGSYHGMAIKGSDGSVWTWGYNGYGELGDGNTTAQANLVRASGLTNVVAIAGGQYHSVAVKADGTVWTWGLNTSGQLGLGSTANRLVPTQVTGFTDAAAGAAGDTYSLVLKKDGTSWVWGANAKGQFGNGTTASSTVPIAAGICADLPASPVSATSNSGALTAAAAHQLAVQATGTICAVGENNFAQLGDGTTIGRTKAVLTASVVNAIGVATSERHSLALLGNGTVWSWGYNGYGELGDGTTFDKLTPIPVPNLTGVTAVAVGTYHSLALKSNGTVWAWGYNASGRLGDGTTTASSVPVQVVGLSDVKAIAAGDDFSMALKNDGTVWTWGNNDNGRLGNGTVTASTSPVLVAGLTDVVAIAAGYYHGMAIRRSDGSVWTWGYNGYGELGSGNNVAQSSPVRANGLVGVMAIAGGQYHSLAVKLDGTVWSWGYNASGQLGIGSTTVQYVPVPVGSLRSASMVAAGANYSVAVKSDGTQWVWGANASGQYGNGGTASSTVPVASAACALAPPAAVVASTQSAAFAASDRHSLAIDNGGTLEAWGFNDEGELGDGTTTRRPTPVKPQLAASAKQVATGPHHSLALLSNGTVAAWGYNGYGELGDGTTANKLTPVAVRNLTQIVGVSAGAYHSLAVKADGSVWAWGINSNGRLGDGTTTTRSTPVLVIGMSDAIAVAAGDDFSLALKRDGTVWAWGNNSSGQLGDGTVTSSMTPGPVPGLTDAISIAAGSAHGMAIKRSDGSVWTWGYNGYGQLGDGDTTARTNIVRASDLTGMVAITGGQSHSLAVKSDGTVWAWGRNTNGQLGTGNTVNSSVPVQVRALTNAVAVAAGYDHSLALSASGEIYAWGSNAAGQFGVETPASRTIPAVSVQGFPSCSGANCGGALAPSSLTLTPPGWNVSRAQLATKPFSQTVQIGSSSPVHFQLSSDASWLQVTASGDTAPATAIVTVLPDALPANQLQSIGNVSVQADGQGPIVFAVTLDRRQESQLRFGTESVNFLSAQGVQRPDSAAVGIINDTDTDQAVAFRVDTSSGGSWLKLSGAPAVVRQHDSAVLTMSISSGIVPGTSDSATVSVVDAQNPSRTLGQLRVKLASAADLPPDLLYTRNDLVFQGFNTLLFGKLPTDRIGIFNRGSAPVGWTATPKRTYLRIAPTEDIALPGAVSTDPLTVEVESLPDTGADLGAINVNVGGSLNRAITVQYQRPPSDKNAVYPPQFSPSSLLVSSTSPDDLRRIRISANNRDALPMDCKSSDQSWLSCPSSSITVPNNTSSPAYVDVAPVIQFDSISGQVGNAKLTFTVTNGSSDLKGNTYDVLVTAVGTGTAATASGGLEAVRRTACQAHALVPAITSLLNEASSPAGIAQVIEVRALDDCGAPVLQADVVVEIRGERSTHLELAPVDVGVWQSTWFPVARTDGFFVVEATVTDRGRNLTGKASVRRNVQSTPGMPVPDSIRPLGAASDRFAGFLSPGLLFELTGTELADGSEMWDQKKPGGTLAGTTVTVGDKVATLLAADPMRLVGLVPFDATLSGAQRVTIARQNGLISVLDVNFVSTTPTLMADAGSGMIATQSLNGCAAIPPGGSVTLYATGLGRVTPAPPSDAPAPSDAPLTTSTRVELNGNRVPVDFAGLVPGQIGLYQVSLKIPQNTPLGNSLILLLSDGTISNTAILPIGKCQ